MCLEPVVASTWLNPQAKIHGQEETAGNGEGRRVGVPGRYQPGLSRGVYLAGIVPGALHAVSSHLIFSYPGDLYHNYHQVGLPLKLVLSLINMYYCFVGSNAFRNASHDEDTPSKVCGSSLGKAGRMIGIKRSTFHQAPQLSFCLSNISYSAIQHWNPLRQKLPPGAEAAAVLAGELGFLDQPLGAFVRLRNPVVLEPLTEVILPSR